MIYTVVWTPKAKDQLAEIWLRATDRQADTFDNSALGQGHGFSAHEVCGCPAS